MTTGMLPTEEMLVEAILSLIRYTHSTCVSAVFDDSHARLVLAAIFGTCKIFKFLLSIKFVFFSFLFIVKHLNL